MRNSRELSLIQKILFKTEFVLVLLLLYIILIIITLLRFGLFQALYIHLVISLIYGLICFGWKFLYFLIFPIFLAYILLDRIVSKIIIRKFDKNVPAEVVVILGRADLFKLEGWCKPIVFYDEIRLLIKLLTAKKQKFAFYPQASIKDIENIMSDKSIREVYFIGHGDSHIFKLNTGEILYYCDFNDFEKYGKEYVHQVHCGTPHGKSLVDYVVPETNRDDCFFYRKSIDNADIKKDFYRRIQNVSKAEEIS